MRRRGRHGRAVAVPVNRRLIAQAFGSGAPAGAATPMSG
jgi:hypothetical protein